MHLLTIYSQKGDIDEMYSYLQLVDVMIKESNSKIHHGALLSYYAQYYRLKGDTTKALWYMEQLNEQVTNQKILEMENLSFIYFWILLFTLDLGNDSKFNDYWQKFQQLIDQSTDEVMKKI